MKVRIAVVKTPAPQAARSPSGTPVTSSLHPPCLPISLEPTTGRPSNISVRRKIRRGLPDEARRRPDLTRHNRLASFLQHCLFRLRVEEPYLARVDHQAHRLALSRRALRRDPCHHQVAAGVLSRPSTGVLLGATPGVFGHLRDALQVDGLLPGRLEVDVFFGAHALYDLRLDIYAARALSPTQGLGRLGLGILHVLGTDAEHDLLASMLPEVLSPSLLYLPHYLAAEGYAGATEGDRVAAVVPLQARAEEVHRRAAYEARDEHVVGVVVHLLWGVCLLDDAVFEDHDPVGHRHRLGLVVRDVDGSRADPVVQLGDLRAHLHPELGVEVGEGFVHEERLRLPVQEALDGEDASRLVDPAVDFALVHLPQLEGKTHVLPHVHVRIERVVLEDHGYVALPGREVVDHVVADEDLPT